MLLLLDGATAAGDLCLMLPLLNDASAAGDPCSNAAVAFMLTIPLHAAVAFILPYRLLLDMRVLTLLIHVAPA